jgi:FAD/FMN-containing dehydrogenase
MPIAVQATGHGASYPMDGGLLINTRRMTRIHIDPTTRLATVGAGVRWSDLLPVAARYGLAGLNGSSTGAGVVGYTLGGGLPVLGRTFGFAAERVQAAEVVTADGAVRRVDAQSDPELFFALRGGKGTAGIVTELTFGLVPVSEIYGGGLFFDGACAEQVLSAYASWTPGLPEEMNSALSFLRLPPLPFVPEPLRGRFVMHLCVAYVGEPADAEEWLKPMRAAAPIMADAVRSMPYPEVDAVYEDPKDPLPAREKCSLLRGLSPDVLRTLLDVAGPGATTPLLKLELRHLGGAQGRAPDVPDAITGRDAAFLVETIGIPAGPQAEAVESATISAHAALTEFSTGRTCVNLHGAVADPEDVARAWEPDTYHRLRRIKSREDPSNLLRFGHAVRPLSNA